MVDMSKEIQITIWDGCNPAVAEAVREFQSLWQPYSFSSRRYPIMRLVKKLIDPAVTTYMSNLPPKYGSFFSGVGAGMAFSEAITLMGLDTMIRSQRQLLRHFINTEDKQNNRDQDFIATIETLIELMGDCDCKRPAKSSTQFILGGDRGLNKQRRWGFCRFCGSHTTLTSFVYDQSQLRGDNDNLRLSDLYCVEHQPRLVSGTWNPLYQRAKRSEAQFDIELERIRKQCTNRNRRLMSGDKLVDDYFICLMLSKTLQPADVGELRNLARRMVDSKLSDTKKKMLVLKRAGFSQAEIGKRILNAKQQPMTRQAVSKALSKIPEEFNLIIRD